MNYIDDFLGGNFPEDIPSYISKDIDNISRIRSFIRAQGKRKEISSEESEANKHVHIVVGNIYSCLHMSSDRKDWPRPSIDNTPYPTHANGAAERYYLCAKTFSLMECYFCISTALFMPTALLHTRVIRYMNYIQKEP